MNLIDLVFVYLWLLGIFIAINFSIFEIRTDGDTILVFLYFAISLLCRGGRQVLEFFLFSLVNIMSTNTEE